MLLELRSSLKEAELQCGVMVCPRDALIMMFARALAYFSFCPSLPGRSLYLSPSVPV